MHVTASGMQTYFTLDKVQSMLINGGGGVSYIQGQSRINNPARQAGHKTQNKDKQN